MDNKNVLHKKYGLLTAICAVVGIIIGSGVFFKAQSVIVAANGKMSVAIGIVIAMGIIMFVCAFTFSTLAGQYEKVNGLVDYAECTVGTKYAYLVNWFTTMVYTPIITGVLAWVSARYFCVLIGKAPFGKLHIILSFVFLSVIFIMNLLSPKLAGKFQVSTTFIKLVPLFVMGVVGTISGLINGTTVETFTSVANTGGIAETSFFSGIASFAFAYEGWIVITALNSEIKNSKRNLPLALVIGCAIAIGIYVLYYVGIASVLTPDQIYNSEDIPKQAFTTLFKSEIFGSVIYAFIVVSCLGTTNALMMGCTRGVYSMAVRGEGIASSKFANVNKKTDMPTASAFAGFLLAAFWATHFIVCFQLPVINGIETVPPSFRWESDEIVILTMYVTYIPIFIAFMRKAGKDIGVVRRFVTPALAILACLFCAYSAYRAYNANGMVYNYLITFVIILLVGMFLYNGKPGLSFFKKSKNK